MSRLCQNPAQSHLGTIEHPRHRQAHYKRGGNGTVGSIALSAIKIIGSATLPTVLLRGIAHRKSTTDKVRT